MSDKNTENELESLRRVIINNKERRDVEIELIKKDLTNLTKIYDKMDSALDKLQQVSSDLSKILDSHDHKIQNNHKNTADIKIEYDKINDKIEKLTDKLDMVIQSINLKTENIKNDLSEEISFLKREISTINNKNILDQEQIKNQKEEIKDIKINIEKNYTSKEQFFPVQKIVYGVTAFILTAVVGLIINTILKGH